MASGRAVPIRNDVRHTCTKPIYRNSFLLTASEYHISMGARLSLQTYTTIEYHAYVCGITMFITHKKTASAYYERRQGTIFPSETRLTSQTYVTHKRTAPITNDVRILYSHGGPDYLHRLMFNIHREPFLYNMASGHRDAPGDPTNLADIRVTQ